MLNIYDISHPIIYVCEYNIQARSQDIPGGFFFPFFLDTVLWAWHLVNYIPIQLINGCDT